MSDEVVNQLKELVECPCGCKAFGAIARTGHSRNCADTCPKCRAGRNRRKGLSKQRTARKALGIPNARVASTLSNEENWRGYFRVEVKAGAQTAPAATRFIKDEHQAEQNKAIGDARPFIDVLMPDGWGSEGLVQLRLSTWRTHVVPLMEGDVA